MSSHLSERSEQKLRRQLNYPRPAAAQPRIGLRLVGSLRDQTRRPKSRDYEEIRQRKIGMVEDVEELRPQLQIHSLEDLSVLADRKIYIPELRPIDFVSSEVAERSKRRVRERVGIQIPDRVRPDSQFELIGLTPGTTFGR